MSDSAVGDPTAAASGHAQVPRLNYEFNVWVLFTLAISGAPFLIGYLTSSPEDGFPDFSQRGEYFILVVALLCSELPGLIRPCTDEKRRAYIIAVYLLLIVYCAALYAASAFQDVMAKAASANDDGGDLKVISNLTPPLIQLTSLGCVMACILVVRASSRLTYSTGDS